MEGCSSNQLDKNYIKYSLDGTSVNILGELSGDDYIIDEGTLEPGESQDYSIRFWLKEGVGNDVLNRHYHGKIVIEAVNEQDKLLDALLSDYTNNESITTYLEGDTTKMYTFQHDATEQTEALTDYRYIGSNPNNYITFNDEMWRIIGVFTVENEKGEKEQRVKIMKDTLLGKMAFAPESNDWTKSDLMTFLNKGDYNSTGNYIDTGLKEESKELIAPAKWYLATPHFNQNGEDSYADERGSIVYSGNSINWIGEVGLIYASDYLYTFALGIDDVCYSTNTNCTVDTGGNPSSSWLYKEVKYWTIAVHSKEGYNALNVFETGKLNFRSVYATDSSVYPVVYLKEDVKMVDGLGTIDNPFQIK